MDFQPADDTNNAPQCCCGNDWQMVRKFQTLPSILLQGLAAAEAQMNNRIVSSLLTGDRRDAQQANFAAQILATSSFFHEVGHEVGKAAQIPRCDDYHCCVCFAVVVRSLIIPVTAAAGEICAALSLLRRCTRRACRKNRNETKHSTSAPREYRY